MAEDTEVEKAAGASRVISGSDYILTFRELVASSQDYIHWRQRWETQRDDALGPILSQERLSLIKGKEKIGHGMSQKERDCLRLRRADEEWIGEARKVVSTSSVE